MNDAMLVQPQQLLSDHQAVLVDCRFSLANSAEGEHLYRQGHIPGAFYMHLENDLSGRPGEHGGRHPLPAPEAFAARLASCGIGRDTAVIAYDDSRLAFAARFWWLMRSLGYRPPRLLDGGYQGFLSAGGNVQSEVPPPLAGDSLGSLAFTGCCDIGELRQSQAAGALLVDSREQKRYQGIEEPIDPVAGHIPGAVNRPWQDVTDDNGRVKDDAGLQAHWGDALESESLVVYCGSGVTACVNLFSLALLGRDEAILYGGSWSDWCSYL